MSLLQYILLIASVFVGGLIAFSIKGEYKDGLKLALSFSGAYLLGITVLHLMPEIYGAERTEGAWPIGLWVLIGFFIQLILEQLSQGVEHGHIHAHSHSKFFALQIMLGLCVHAFIEGMPLEVYDGHASHAHHGHDHGHDHGHQHLLYGIILHKAPAAFALVLLFIVSKVKKPLIILYLSIFAMMSPLGAGFAKVLVDQGLLNTAMFPVILSVVVGSFLHIATTILFEVDGSDHHNISLKRIGVIVLGVGAALLTLIH